MKVAKLCSSVEVLDKILDKFFISFVSSRSLSCPNETTELITLLS